MTHSATSPTAAACTPCASLPFSTLGEPRGFQPLLAYWSYSFKVICRVQGQGCGPAPSFATPATAGWRLTHSATRPTAAACTPSVNLLTCVQGLGFRMEGRDEEDSAT